MLGSQVPRHNDIGKVCISSRSGRRQVTENVLRILQAECSQCPRNWSLGVGLPERFRYPQIVSVWALCQCGLSSTYGKLNPKTFLKCTRSADDSKAENTAAPQSTRRSCGIQSRIEKTSNGRTGIKNLEMNQKISM